MLVRNVLYNLAGLAAPVLLALLCIPPLLAGMGTARFGLLTLVWVVLGYFSVFDLGIGRALTLAVADRQARGRVADISPLIITGLQITAALGFLGGLLLIVMSNQLARLMASGDIALMAELRPALMAVAFALPFVTMTAAMRGVLEAHGRFDITSAIRLGMGFITYGGPLVVLQFRQGLTPVVFFLVAARTLTWAVHAIGLMRVIPPQQVSPRRFSSAELRPLLVSGGWMTVSNVISPMLSYLDRFVLAGLVGVAMVAYYTTPYEAVSRLTLIPEAVLGVLFPTLGAALALDPARAQRLYGQCLRVMVSVMLPVAAAVVAFAHPLLSLWISPSFANQSFRVLQVLAVGIAINCVARLPFTAIQSAGRADLTARLHVIELPVFLLVLSVLTRDFGIVGTAWAWATRAAVDLGALAWIQRRQVPLRADLGWGWGWLALGGLLTALGAFTSEQALPTLFAVKTALVLIVVTLAWFGVLNQADRALLGSYLARLRRRG